MNERGGGHVKEKGGQGDGKEDQKNEEGSGHGLTGLGTRKARCNRL